MKEFLAQEREGRTGQPSAEVNSSKKFLIVDDYPAYTYLFGKVLQSMGHEYISVDNGEEAIEKAIEDHCDLDGCFIDISLPKISVIEAARRIRNYEQKQGIEELPIVAIATLPHQHTKEIREAGIEKVVIKSENPSHLRATLSQITKKLK